MLVEDSFILGGSTLTDATIKSFRFGVNHYDNSQKPFIASLGTVTAGSSIAYFGGGSSLGVAATALQFYTASNNTTDIGTEVMRINSAQNVGIGTGSSISAKFHIVGSTSTSGTNSFLIENSSGNDLMAVNNVGQLKLNQYTGGSFDGTPQHLLGVDGSGNVVKATSAGDLSNTWLQATDDRDMAPEDISFDVDFALFFSSKLGLDTGTTTDGDYQDVIYLNTWNDASGGDANILAFDKSSMQILHYQADQAATNWGTPKTLAYAEDVITPTLQTVTDEGNTTTNSIITSSSENSTPASESTVLSKFGILGNRGTMYVTNTGDNLILGTGGVHSAGNKMHLSSTGLRLQDNVNAAASAKLHVVGGAKAINANALLVENAEGDNLLRITDDNFTRLGSTIEIDVENGYVRSIGTDGLGGEFHARTLTSLNSWARDLVINQQNSSKNILLNIDSVEGFRLKDNKQLKFAQYTGTNFDGTPTSILGVDASGNVVKTDASNIITDTPTLQSVTDEGATTTNLVSFSDRIQIGSTSALGATTRSRIVVGGSDVYGLLVTNSSLSELFAVRADGTISQGNKPTKVGKDTLLNVTSGGSVAIGVNAAKDVTSLSTSIVAIGKNSLTGHTGMSQTSVYVGENSAQQDSTSTTALINNVVIGHTAGRNIEGSQNVIIGSQSGGSTVTGSKGSDNVIIGYGALQGGIDGTTNNVIIGSQTGQFSDNIGSNNTIIGHKLVFNTDDSISDEVIIGQDENVRLRFDSSGDLHLPDNAASSGKDALLIDDAGKVSRTAAVYQSSITATTSGTGEITIAHGLSYTPTSCTITVKFETGSAGEFAQVVSIDATNIVAKVFVGVSGTTVNSSNRTLYYTFS